MTNPINYIVMFVAFIPFIIFVLINAMMNLKREVRNKQFFMPFVAVAVALLLFVFMNKLSGIFYSVFYSLVFTLDNWALSLSEMNYLGWLSKALAFIAGLISDFLTKFDPTYVLLVLFNVCSMLGYLIVKKLALLVFAPRKHNTSLTNSFVSVFYDFDEKTGCWYIKNHFGQAKTFLKTAYYATAAISAIAVFVSFYLCEKGLIIVPFYPIFPIIIMGEMAFFIDGLEFDQLGNKFSAEIDDSRHITNYVILRKKLGELFGDKVLSDGTTLNDGVVRGGSIDQILEEIKEEYGKLGENYAMFIRKKSLSGFKPNADYLRSGVELASGKSLLFNTPFYYKLTPYMFYAMHSALLKGGKVLIVLGRHGTSDDIINWCNDGICQVTGLPSLWDIKKLDKEGEPCDIGIVTRSGVHDLELHKANREFLNEVSFVFLLEPSRLVTTAQIGLNLLVRNISVNNNAVYCSVDKNCDGLVDSLSHIIMTNITEVSATEFPEGTSSYMCWKADSEFLQHRITPGITRYLGVGTELSLVALKNHVEKVVWYGGDAYPVLDQHWIAKQYYHDLLSTTPLPVTQETFDKFFKVSFNFCNERTKDNSFVIVEDEFFNLFEVKREFSTISKKQGFVNVISSDYMLRDYMTMNNEVFIADPKAIPYISADYARTKRNIILKICLQMSILGIFKEEVIKEFNLIGIDHEGDNLKEIIWENICEIYCKNGEREIIVTTPSGVKTFTEDIIIYKREFSVETGKFEDIFVITDNYFKQYVIDDLQSARYIAERGNESSFLGTELKGHILQKYLPGQFITLGGKYYEMLSIASDNHVIVRRAADHINSRLSYRQIRNITIDSAYDNDNMGMLKSVNGVKIYNQFADFSVATPAYWRMYAYNDFENAKKVVINNVPTRKYINKNILKLDFSDFGEAFTNEIRTTLTLLINEVFKTMFAENQPFIVALTKGDYEKPLTYSLSGDAVEEKCIYIIEDSQLDIGLLVAVERNIERIMRSVADYLDWNKTVYYPEPIPESEEPVVEEEAVPEEKVEKNPFKRIFNKIKSLFGRSKKKKDLPEVPAQDYMMIYGKPHKKINGKWVACSQEEFDRKMENRHQAIEEKKEAEREIREAEKLAEQEKKKSDEPVEEEIVVSEELSDETDVPSKDVSRESPEEITDDSAEDSSDELADEITEDSLEEPVDDSADNSEEVESEESNEVIVDDSVKEKGKKKGIFSFVFGKKEKKDKKEKKRKKKENAEAESSSDEPLETDVDIAEQSHEEKEEELDVSGV